MGKYRYTKLLLLASNLLLLSQIHVATANSFTITARLTEITPRAGQATVTCDGGHGVFFCKIGTCRYDNSGAFACCDRDDCVPKTTCIPSGTAAGGKTCGGDRACLSCTDSSIASCYTISNPGMTQRALFCATIGGTQATSYTYDMARMTEPLTPTSTSSAVSTLIGDPVKISSMNTAFTFPTSTQGPATMTASSSGSVANPSSSLSGNGTAPVATQTPIFDKVHMLPGSTIAGIAVGAIAGLFVLTLALFLLYKWYKDRQVNRDSGAGGVLPGPRENASDEIRAAIRPNELDGTSPINELSGHPPVHEPSSNERSNVSSPTYSPDSSNWSPVPPPPSVIGHSRLRSVDSFGPAVTVTEPGSSHHLEPSSHYIETPPPFTPFSAGFSPKFRPASDATLCPPDPADEYKRKSSKLLPMAGPYLTAERALGEGFWEAEKEQAEADKAIAEEREDGTRKMSVGEGEVEIKGMESPGSEASTGTVIRRSVKTS